MMARDEHEQLLVCYDSSTNLRAFIAIHETTLGPALGGCRMWNYATEEEAILDALRLSKATTYKAAVTGCDLGGGCAILWGDPKTDKSEAYFRALGRFVHSLNGKFIATTELGTDFEDLIDIKRETPYVVALPEIYGGSGDTSATTAWGVYNGMLACAQEAFGVSSLDGLTIAVQGVGNIGSHLIETIMRNAKNVRLVMSDIDYDCMKKVQDKYPETKIASPSEILQMECDIMAPCALGRIFTKENIETLRCKIIAGGASDILEDDSIADDIFGRGILLAPDFVINAGEMIQAADELRGFDKEKTKEFVRRIYLILGRILAQAKEEGVSPYRVANRIARERIQRIARVKQIHC